ncbi:hypothetical protein M885DRAFT_534433 [Pelagophyceae sp. CCMP2097]|nr:hypothetical protein M885DRAFT_534433 [Pelagophyceae sp. CCMP2097]
MLAVSQVGVSLAVGVSLGVAHSAVVARRAQRLLDARLDAAGIEAALAAGEVTAILDAAVGADSRVDCVLSLQGGTAVRCDCDVLRRAHAACKASPLATPPLVFVVDASGGVGVAVALAALRAAGLRADGGGRWLQALGAAARSGAVQPSAAVRAIDACLALEAHLAASAGAAAAVVLPTETYVFLAPHLFGWFPQARWVLAYSSASRAAGACACVGADADEERESLASEACAPLLSKLRPRAAARRVDSWLAVIGATLDLKDVSEAASFAALDPSLVRHFLPYMLKIDFILEPSTRAQALKQLVE